MTSTSASVIWICGIQWSTIASAIWKGGQIIYQLHKTILSYPSDLCLDIVWVFANGVRLSRTLAHAILVATLKIFYVIWFRFLFARISNLLVVIRFPRSTPNNKMDCWSSCFCHYLCCNLFLQNSRPKISVIVTPFICVFQLRYRQTPNRVYTFDSLEPAAYRSLFASCDLNQKYVLKHVPYFFFRCCLCCCPFII